MVCCGCHSIKREVALPSSVGYGIKNQEVPELNSTILLPLSGFVLAISVVSVVSAVLIIANW